MYDLSGQDPFKGLTDLFKSVRDELLAGDLRAVWAMCETYGGYEENEPDPVESLSDSGDTQLDIRELHLRPTANVLQNYLGPVEGVGQQLVIETFLS
jgi:hypothetical protein